MTEPRHAPDTLSAQVDAVLARLHRIARDFSPAALASSLGAEDMVLTDLIVRSSLPISVFSLDTGRLPQETHDLLAEVKRHYGLEITVYTPRHDLVEAYVNTYGTNAFRESVERRQECCRIRKVEPLRRALAGKAAWITGLRAQQSATREALPIECHDHDHGLMKFNPLADWTEADVWAYLRQNGVPTNALHARHYPSIGCAPCTRAIAVGEDIRAGRWWWEAPESKECGLHASPIPVHRRPAQ